MMCAYSLSSQTQMIRMAAKQTFEQVLRQLEPEEQSSVTREIADLHELLARVAGRDQDVKDGN